MKNKDFDSFNNDRILAARKRVIDLLYLIGSWEEQKQQKQKTMKDYEKQIIDEVLREHSNRTDILIILQDRIERYERTIDKK